MHSPAPRPVAHDTAPDGSPLGHVLLAADGKMLAIDDVAAAMTGRPPQTLVGRPFTSVLAPGSRIFWLAYSSAGPAAPSLAIDLLDETGTRVHVQAEIRSPATNVDALPPGTRHEDVHLEVVLRAAAGDHLEAQRVATLRRLVDIATSRSEAIVAALPEALVVLDDVGGVEAWNAAAVRLLQIPESLALNRPFADVVSGYQRPLADAVERALATPWRATHRLDVARGDGAIVPLEVTVGNAQVRGEAVTVLLLRDASDVQLPSRHVTGVPRSVMGAPGTRFGAPVTPVDPDVAPPPGLLVATISPQGIVTSIELSGDLAGILDVDAVVGVAVDQVMTVGRGLHTAIQRGLDGVASTAPLHVGGRDWLAVVQPRADGGAVVVAVDMDGLHQLEHDAALDATIDSVTGLPNRSWLHRVITAQLAEALPGESVSLLLLDIDDFTDLNDTLGQQAGDAVLTEAGRRLVEAAPAHSVVTRQSGDGFAILLGTHQHDQAELLALRITQALSRPFQLDDADSTRITMSASVGIARWPQDSRSSDDLMAHADAALRRARSSGLSIASYDERRDDPSDRFHLVRRLREAIVEGGITAHFQPIVRLSDGSLRGVEALVRWPKPSHGPVGAAEMAAAAESARLIDDLGAVVVERSCEQLAAWDRQGYRVNRVSVNVSPLQLRSGRFAPLLKECARRHHLGLDRFTIEITESAVGSLDEPSLRTLHQLRDLGALVALDDFGTGQSSLARLRDMPVDVIKLDRSFVSGLPDAVPAALITAFVGVARALGLTTVAEGVETVEQHDALATMGCTYGQGYLYGRPVPGPDLGDPQWPGRPLTLL